MIEKGGLNGFYGFCTDLRGKMSICHIQNAIFGIRAETNPPNPPPPPKLKEGMKHEDRIDRVLPT